MNATKSFVIAALLLASPAQAQDETGAALSSEQQKFSYAIGLQIGQSLARQGVEIDPAVFSMAVRDAMSGAEPRMSAEEADRIVKSQQVAVIKARADRNAKAGDAFRSEYKQKEGTKAFDNGILYRVLKEGIGSKPTVNDTVEVNYTGKFINGKEFDSSAAQGGPVSFPLKGIIKGWQEALQQMTEGSKWEIVVPPELGYGMEGGGPIGPNETLVFVIELIKVGGKPAAAN